MLRIRAEFTMVFQKSENSSRVWVELRTYQKITHQEIQIKPQKETQHQSEDKDRKLDNFWLANTLKYLMKVPDYKASGYIKNPGYSYQKEYKV